MDPNQPSQEHDSKEAISHGHGGGTVVLHGTGRPCHFAAHFAKHSSKCTVEVFLCFGLEAKPKGVALAWIKHGHVCGNGYGCVKWKDESK